MNKILIDVWDPGTFDDDLLEELREHEQLIRDYWDTEITHSIERESSDHRWLPPNNFYSGEYSWLIDHIVDYVGYRSIRAWHYTRLTEDEVIVVRQCGLYPSTLETIRRRLDVRVAAGDFTATTADSLFASSPFGHREQLAARSGKFWMTSHPIQPDDGGVELLLGSWGGQGVHFWLQDRNLKELVARLGKPRVLELAVPICVTRHAREAAEAVIGAFARSLGCTPERGVFGLYSTSVLGAESLITIHTEGERNFALLAGGYPAGLLPRE